MLGGRDYVQFVSSLLSGKMPQDTIFSSSKYELILFDSLSDMREAIKRRNDQYELSRLVAGFSWPWKSKKNKSITDIHIEDVALQWNRVPKNWIHSVNAVNEVGCIHTTQGYDLNYTGIIFGNEISYNQDNKQIVINKSNYHDRSGKTGLENGDQLKAYIVNVYKTLMLRGIRGTYIYVCDKNLRTYFENHITQPTYKMSSAELSKYGADPPMIPLYDLQAAAGVFSEAQRPDRLGSIPLPADFRFSEDLFACTVVGKSMNRIIPENSVCLFRRYSGGSRDGKIVLVELDDLQDQDSGSKFTVKEYRSVKIQTNEGWEHTSITLKAMSTLNEYKDIILERSEINSLKVIGIFEGVM